VKGLRKNFYRLLIDSPKILPASASLDKITTDGSFHFNLGTVYFAIGKKNEATEEYRVLATLDQRLAKKLKDSMEK
jgi:hypothetical protein